MALSSCNTTLRRLRYPDVYKCQDYVNAKVATKEIAQDRWAWEIQCCRAAFNEAPAPAPFEGYQPVFTLTEWVADKASFVLDPIDKVGEGIKSALGLSNDIKDNAGKLVTYLLYAGGAVLGIYLLTQISKWRK